MFRFKDQKKVEASRRSAYPKHRSFQFTPSFIANKQKYLPFYLLTPSGLISEQIAFIIIKFEMGKRQTIYGKKKAAAKRKYDKISYEARVKLIQSVLTEKCSVAAAGRALGIKSTTGCLILRNYKKEGRIFHKPGTAGPECLPHLPAVKPPKSKKLTRDQRYEARNKDKTESRPDNQEKRTEIKIESEVTPIITNPQSSPISENYCAYPGGMMQAIPSLLIYQYYPYYWSNFPNQSL